MLPESHLLLHETHAAELHAAAAEHRRARDARQPRDLRDLRVRLGWTLVEVGLRMASAPRELRPAAL
ncbi:hypothetical protein ACIBUY_30780 [Streptomyces sp. NPDC050085]|uniref:hypothetical protein n=1 Tax=Streptomyces sp. NPDC050085 TaxID=3365600 RepID=UPI0037BD1EE0